MHIDSYYLEPLNQIDDEIKEKLNGVEAKFEWSKTFKVSCCQQKIVAFIS